VGGLGPGLLATVLACLCTDFYLFPPVGSVWFERSLDFAQWLFLLLEGVLISVLFGLLARSRPSGPVASARSRARLHRAQGRPRFHRCARFLGVIGIVSYLSVVRLTENSALVTRSHVVMSNIDALVATTWEAESAQRGYIITGEEPFAADTRAPRAASTGWSSSCATPCARCRRSCGARTRWPRWCANACAEQRHPRGAPSGGMEAVQRGSRRVAATRAPRCRRASRSWRRK
jgi:hypothetical protein